MWKWYNNCEFEISVWFSFLTCICACGTYSVCSENLKRFLSRGRNISSIYINLRAQLRTRDFIHFSALVFIVQFLWNYSSHNPLVYWETSRSGNYNPIVWSSVHNLNFQAIWRLISSIYNGKKNTKQRWCNEGTLRGKRCSSQKS